MQKYVPQNPVSATIVKTARGVDRLVSRLGQRPLVRDDQMTLPLAVYNARVPLFVITARETLRPEVFELQTVAPLFDDTTSEPEPASRVVYPVPVFTLVHRGVIVRRS